jgi:transposase
MVEKQNLYLTSFQRKLLQRKLQSSVRPEYRRRIEVMLMADQGWTQSQICSELKCSQETARYWIAVAQSGQAHFWNERPMGRPKVVSDEYLYRLRKLVSHSPREFGYSFDRWTAHWLSHHLEREFNIHVSDRHINRLLKSMGLSTRRKPLSTPACLPSVPDAETNIAIRDLQPSQEPSALLTFWLADKSFGRNVETSL